MGEIMNKTKRKIFETSMKLFAEKGYESTSIEEITATVGVAKGTLYYHFSSKEEIFNFLVEEGMKLLKNSIEIKTSKLENSIDKLKAIVLIELKVLVKYEYIITIILNQIWGHEARNLSCRSYVLDYIATIENIIKDGIKKGEIINANSHLIASNIFGITCSTLIYKMQNNQNLDIQTLYKEYVNTIISGLSSK